MNESSSASGGNGEICNFNKVKLMKKQRMNEKILKKTSICTCKYTKYSVLLLTKQTIQCIMFTYISVIPFKMFLL